VKKMKKHFEIKRKGEKKTISKLKNLPNDFYEIYMSLYTNIQQIYLNLKKIKYNIRL